MFDRLKAILLAFLRTPASGGEKQEKTIDQEEGSFDGRALRKGQSFDADYHAATQIVKLRMNNRYPDNYYARASSGADQDYSHGEERAVDAASAAIALALRNGATVKEAADAGAASIGL